MHEYHLIKPLVHTIEEKVKSLPKLKRVTRISVKLGILKMVTKEHFSETFKELSKGSICEGAQLDIEEVPGDILFVENVEGEFEE
jgi:Zn finger protein HypA/HybF involved in hydrogenase expression